MNSEREVRSAASEANPRVLISSLYPLGGNYGGILQAYALQQVILGLGYDVLTIDSARKWAYLRYAVRRLLYAAKAPGQRALPLSPWAMRLVQKETRRFVAEHIRTVDFFAFSRRQRREFLNRVHAIVVGSDQVWRGGYADVLDQLLRYAVGRDLIRVSYAASFGADRLIRYSRRDRKHAPRLAQQFDAISVREESGVELCRTEWDCAAVQHVDPTLLLRREAYFGLVGVEQESPSEQAQSSGVLSAYILDQNSEVESFVSGIAAQLGLSPSYMSTEKLQLSEDCRTDTAPFEMRSVEDWLRHLNSADFVVTDSFHGTVFSLIFNKPFLAIGNYSRGISRFTSLLNLLRLQDRLIDLKTSPSVSLNEIDDIDWADVNSRIEDERTRALEYLKRHL